MYQKEGQAPRPGMQAEDGNVIDLGAAGKGRGFWTDMPSVKALLERPDGLALARKIWDDRESCVAEDGSECKLLAPLPDADKILGVALNYKDFCERGSLPLPKALKIFGKYRTAINRPQGIFDIRGRNVTYEGELGVVIGKRCRNVKAADADAYIAGYTAVNDFTANDLVKEDVQLFRGKNLDGAFPMGPVLVTKDEIGDPMNLRIRTEVDGEIRQASTTNQMIFDIWEQIEYFSSFMTLMPGDVIASGTPAGTALQFDPPRFLKAGQQVRVSIEKIGTLVTDIQSNT